MRTVFGSLQGNLSRRPALADTLRSFSWMLIERFVGLGSALLVTIPIARHLGTGDFGALNYLLAVSGLVGPLAAMGLNHIVTKELMHAPDRVGAILGTTGMLRKVGAGVATAIVIAWMLVDPPADGRLPVFVVLIVAANLLSSMTFLQYWFLTNGTTNAYTIGQICTTLLFAGIRLVLVLLGMGLEAFMIVSVIEVVGLGIATYIAYLRVRPHKIRWSIDRGLARKLLSRSWPLILSGVSAGIYLKLGVIMLAEQRGNAVAGTYAAAARLSEIWYFVPTLLMTAAFPTLVAFRRKSDALYQARLQDIYDMLAAAGTMLALVVSVGAPFIVHTLFGPAYADAGPILAIHVWAGVFIFMRQLLSRWMILEDLYIFSFVTHGVGAAVNVALNLYLIPHYGGIGAAWATLISYASASYLALLCHRRTLPAFAMMSRALLWPRRLPDFVRYAATWKGGHSL